MSESQETFISCCKCKGPCAGAGGRAAITHEFRSGRLFNSPFPDWGTGSFVPGLCEKWLLPVARGVVAFPLGKLKGEELIRCGSCSRWIYGLFGASCTNFANAVCLQALNSCIPG